MPISGGRLVYVDALWRGKNPRFTMAHPFKALLFFSFPDNWQCLSLNSEFSGTAHVDKLYDVVAIPQMDVVLHS